MSRRQVYFVKAASPLEAMVDVGIETIGSQWPDPWRKMWMVEKTAVRHQRGRFKVVCTYKPIGQAAIRISG